MSEILLLIDSVGLRGRILYTAKVSGAGLTKVGMTLLELFRMVKKRAEGVRKDAGRRAER
jgi:hypothetical protein